MKTASRSFVLLFLCLLTLRLDASLPFGGEDSPVSAADGSQPVTRGYLIPTVEPAPGGAKLTVDIYLTDLNNPVSLTLQAVVNDNGNNTVLNLETLNSRAVSATSYKIRQEFFIDYQRLNALFGSRSRGLVIGAGTPLFVYGEWLHGGHTWGGGLPSWRYLSSTDERRKCSRFHSNSDSYCSF